MTQLYEKLKERWQADSLWQVLLILFIFSISGMSVLYVRVFFFDWMGIDAATPFWLKSVLWLVVVFPSYQALFLFYGFILGQFEFVWNFEKKSFSRLGRLFGVK